MDVMVDLETTSSGTNAAILAIGAVAFHIDGPLLTINDISIEGQPNCFYENIDLQSCLNKGLEISANTFYWWLQQSDMARSVIQPKRQFLEGALREFSSWFARVAHGPVWSHATFDLPLLSNAYSKCLITPPYKYVNLFDVRTMKHLAGPVETPQDHPHHALYDAYRQAVEVQLCYQRLLSK